MEPNISFSPAVLDSFFSFHSTAGKNQNFSSSIMNQPFFFSSVNQPASDFLFVHAGGKISYSSTVTYHASALPAYLLILVTEGAGTFRLDSEEFSLQPGSVLLVPEDREFHFSTVKTPFSYQLYFINGSTLPVYLNRLSEAGSNSFFTMDSAQTGYIKNAMQQIDHLLKHQTEDFFFLTAKLLTDLLTEFVILSGKETIQSSSVPSHVQKMKQIFDYDYAMNHSLDDLEEEIGIGKYRLCHDFSKYMDISPLQYLNQKRIEKAKELLVQTEATIHSIGTQVGIPNTNHFIRLFQRNTGVTPLQYRQSRKIAAVPSPSSLQ